MICTGSAACPLTCVKPAAGWPLSLAGGQPARRTNSVRSVELGKEGGITGAKAGREIFVGGQLEILATNFHRDHFFITQGGGKSASAQRIKCV